MKSKINGAIAPTTMMVAGQADGPAQGFPHRGGDQRMTRKGNTARYHAPRPMISEITLAVDPGGRGRGTIDPGAWHTVKA